MPEEKLTMSSMCLSIYSDLISTISHDIIVESLIREQILRLHYGKLSEPSTYKPSLIDQSIQVNGGNNSNSATPSQSNSRNPSPNTELLTRTAYVNIAGRDIFGNEKIADSMRFFTCTNCSRKISGNRFAAHIDRCLGGRQRK